MLNICLLILFNLIFIFFIYILFNRIQKKHTYEVAMDAINTINTINTINNNQTENCQILGWANGINPDDAFEKLKIEINFENINFDKVSCQELQSGKNYYFSLND